MRTTMSVSRAQAAAAPRPAHCPAARPGRTSRRIVVAPRAEAAKPGATAPAGGLGGLLGTITRTLGTLSTRAGGPQRKGPKDASTVFVAGATGRLGVRVVRELLNAGFRVRAAARDVDAAEETAAVAAALGLVEPEQLAKLTWVEFDLEDPDSMAAAIGNASKVVCTVGAPETAALEPTAPRRIDGDGTIALIEAAAGMRIEQFVLVTSLGTGKVGFPAAALNLFWGVLSQKRRAEVALERSGMSYVIMRPGGMERPKDDYKLTHALTVKPRDSTFGGQVSRLQVAELVAATLTNPELSLNKCFELVAEEGVPEVPLPQLLEALPSEITKEEQEAAAQVVAEARAELEQAQAALRAAQEEAAVAADKAAQLAEALKEAKAAEKEARAEVAPVLREGKAAVAELAAAEAAADKAAREELAARAVLEAAKKAGAGGELLSTKQLQAVAAAALNPPKQEEAVPAVKAASPFALFAPRPAAAAVEVEEEEEEEEEVVVAVQRPPSPFAALFGGLTSARQVEEAEEEEEELVVEEEEEEEPARPASPFAALFGGISLGRSAPAAEPEEEEEEITPEPTPAAPVAAAKPASPFAALFGGSAAAIQIGDDTKISVPDRPDAAEPAEPRRTAAVPAAPAAVRQAAAPPAVDAAAAAAAEAKRKAALEEAKAKLAQEQAAAEAEAAAREAAAAAAAQRAADEAAALAAVKAEREAEAARAKQQAEERAAAEKAAAEKAAAEKAAAEKVAAEKVAAEKATAEKAAAEQAAAQQTSTTAAGEESVAANVAEARAWIEAWRAKTASGASSSSSSGGSDAPTPAAAPAPPAVTPSSSSGSAGANGAADVPANVAEARQWIANWRARSADGGPSGDSNAESGPTNDTMDDVVVVMEEGEGIFASVGRMFGGFGGEKK